MNVVLMELTIDFIILVTFIGLMIIVLIVSFFFNEKRKTRRFLNKLPEKRIGSLQLNELVKVTGNVSETTVPFIAPLSKKNCVYYSFKIEEQKKEVKITIGKLFLKRKKHKIFLLKKKEI